MATNQEPRTKNQGQRAKRKYTVSDKVRAANRIKLGKALSVDKKIRYRLTPKRLAANRTNLRKALQTRRYKRYARDWVRAVGLRKTAAEAGETQEEYDRHMELGICHKINRTHFRQRVEVSCSSNLRGICRARFESRPPLRP